MQTYSKKNKKTSLLRSFSVLRGSPRRKIVEKKGKDGVATTTAVPASTSAKPSRQTDRALVTHHDDSIDEMASQLLDDTTMDQIYMQPGNRMSQVSISKAMPHLPHLGSSDKAPPRLPQLTSNGDDAWALRQSPVVAAHSRESEMSFSGSSQALGPLVGVRTPLHRRKSFAPLVPPKSSKRHSSRPKRTSSNLREEYESHGREGLPVQINSFRLVPQSPNTLPQAQSSLPVGIDIQNKIDALMAVRTPKAKDPDNTPQKRDHLKENNYLTKIQKIKKSINIRRLFDHTESKGAANCKPDVSSLSFSTRIATNLQRDKVFLLTGDGGLRRKAVLKEENMSAENINSITGDISLVARSDTSILDHDSDNESAIESGSIPELPVNPIRTPSPDTDAQSTYDFDALLTSSPAAQSTPRLRLEPSLEENGHRSLKTVPSDARSMFDLDDTMIGYDLEMDIDGSQEPEYRRRGNIVKRKSSQVNMLHSEQLHASKKFMTKKHPSPSKEVLDVLGLQLDQVMMKSKSVPVLSKDKIPLLRADQMDEGTSTFTQAEEPRLRIETRALSPKSKNKLIQRATEEGRECKAVGVPEKPELSTSTSMLLLSFPTRSRHPKNSMVPQPVSQHENQGNSEAIKSDASMLDIDPLQWDKTTYDIGMRRA